MGLGLFAGIWEGKLEERTKHTSVTVFYLVLKRKTQAARIAASYIYIIYLLYFIHWLYFPLKTAETLKLSPFPHHVLSGTELGFFVSLSYLSFWLLLELCALGIPVAFHTTVPEVGFHPGWG